MIVSDDELKRLLNYTHMWISESLYNSVPKKETLCKIIRSNADPRRTWLVCCPQRRPTLASSPSGLLQL